MNELEDSFAKLLGRQPTDAERQQLYRVKDALGLKNNDALWLVLMALEFYNDQYRRFPDLIQSVAIDTIKGFKIAADATARASIEAAKSDMAKAVQTTAIQVARDVAGKDRIQWLIGSLLASAIILGSFGYFMNRIGYNEGVGVGYSEAKDEKAAAAWANTPQGKQAYELAKSTDIDALVNCSRPGWHIKKGVCIVGPTSDKETYGWSVP